jgi:hypothetical protein
MTLWKFGVRKCVDKWLGSCNFWGMENGRFVGKRPSLQSVVLGKHDGQHSGCSLRVRRILRAPCHAFVIVVYFPKERVLGEFEATKVVFSVGIIAESEAVEGTHSLKRLTNQNGRKSAHACGDDQLATFEGAAERVVERSDFYLRHSQQAREDQGTLDRVRAVVKAIPLSLVGSDVRDIFAP